MCCINSQNNLLQIHSHPWFYSRWQDLGRPTNWSFLNLSYLDPWQCSLGRGINPLQRSLEGRGQAYMPWAGFQTTIPPSKQSRPTRQTARLLGPAITDTEPEKGPNKICSPIQGMNIKGETGAIRFSQTMLTIYKTAQRCNSESLYPLHAVVLSSVLHWCFFLSPITSLLSE